MVEGLEAPFRRKDGSVLTGLMSASLIEIEGEACVLTMVRDITQLRAQARQLEGLTQMYAALSQVNQAIVFSPTREALLDKICEVMVMFGRFSMVWIAWNDPASHEVRVLSSYGDANGYLDGLEVRSDDTPMACPVWRTTSWAIRMQAPGTVRQPDADMQPQRPSPSGRTMWSAAP
jgi:hypothetical protein